MRSRLNRGDVRKAGQLKAKGLADKDIAAALGFSPQTLCRWIRHPETQLQRELGEELARAEWMFRQSLIGTITEAAGSRDWRAAAWLLARRYPKEFAEVRRVSIDTNEQVDDAGERLEAALAKMGFTTRE